MKYFIIFSCFIAITYADSSSIMGDLISSGRKASSECQVEFGITDDEITKMKQHKIPTSTSGKCFVFCVQKKLNFMTEDGQFIKENGYKFLDLLKDVDSDLYGKLLKVANTCYAEVEVLPDPCETSTNMHICVELQKKANGVPQYEL